MNDLNIGNMAVILDIRNTIIIVIVNFHVAPMLLAMLSINPTNGPEHAMAAILDIEPELV